MPYADYPLLLRPPDEAKLWRYMDIAKFVALLEDKALYFPSVETLNELDPFEGAVPKGWAELVNIAHGKSAKESLGESNRARRFFFVSCWHRNEQESAAMWRLYLKSDEGICVQSTVGRLIRAIRDSEHEINISDVQYMSYEKGALISPHPVVQMMWKRKSFEHEREVRAITNDRASTGIHVPVDLSDLIETVFVAPACAPWVRSLVEKVLKRYGVDAPVKQSALDAKPLY